jgi:hypothetical protein
MASTTTSAADGKDYAARQHAFAQQLQDEVASRAYTGAVMSAGMDLFVYCAAEKFKHDPQTERHATYRPQDRIESRACVFCLSLFLGGTFKN